MKMCVKEYFILKTESAKSWLLSTMTQTQMISDLSMDFKFQVRCETEAMRV